MTFSEKLDLLMRLSGTSNSALARYVNLDASYVSRLRHGMRTPSKNENYIAAVSQFFARFSTSEVFKVALCEAMKLPQDQLSLSFEHTSIQLHQWLIDNTYEQPETIGNFLDHFANFKFSMPITFQDELHSDDQDDPFYSTHFGIEGKRTAVLEFLNTALMNANNETLYLYSDESMEWLTGDRHFVARWGSLMAKVIQRGHKIIIIHTLNRGLDEMLSAIKGWLPLYMTGSIEPYYYPRTRDDLHKHTLFILGHQVVLSSHSVGMANTEIMVHLYRDPAVVEHYFNEFDEYLTLCKPLMRIFTSFQQTDFLGVLKEFESKSASCSLLSEGLSTMTLPVTSMSSMLKRSPLSESQINNIIRYQAERTELLKCHLAENTYVEFITLPKRVALYESTDLIPSSHKTVSIKPLISSIYFAVFIGLESVYTADEYKAHLMHVIWMLHTFPNYHLFILDQNQPLGYSLYYKENAGVLVSKNISPYAVFAINESRMCAAFSDYIKTYKRNAKFNKGDRLNTIAKLEELLRQFQEIDKSDSV